MKIAVNFSDTLLVLLKEDPKLPIDYIKVPMGSYPSCFEQYFIGKQLRPLISHVGQVGIFDILNIDQSKRLDIRTLAKINSLSDSAKLSTHLNGHIIYFPEFIWELCDISGAGCSDASYQFKKSNCRMR